MVLKVITPRQRVTKIMFLDHFQFYMTKMIEHFTKIRMTGRTEQFLHTLQNIPWTHMPFHRCQVKFVASLHPLPQPLSLYHMGHYIHDSHSLQPWILMFRITQHQELPCHPEAGRSHLHQARSLTGRLGSPASQMIFRQTWTSETRSDHQLLRTNRYLLSLPNPLLYCRHPQGFEALLEIITVSHLRT